MNIKNRYDTSFYMPRTSKQSYLQAGSNVINFGNARHITKKVIVKQSKTSALKTKLANLWEYISVFAYRRSEKLLNMPQMSDLKKIHEQQTAIRTLTNNLDKATAKITRLTNEKKQNETQIKNLHNEITALEQQVSSANSQISDLKTEMQNAKQQLEDALTVKETNAIDPILKEKIEHEVLGAKLNYDVMSPYFETIKPLYSPKKYKYSYEDIPVGTNNRADMKELVIPNISLSGNFDFELPKGDMQIKKISQKELKEPFEILSNISDKYNESLVWDTGKIVRDLLQNFYDGHGQTLDGVRFIFKPSGIGKYKVRIEGKSIYNYKEAVLLGESQSHGDIKAAGNYGEGLKMVTLKLLTQNKAPCVKVGSGNWEIICNLKKDDRLDSTLMNYKISPAENYDGNYIEFETSDRNLLETIRKFINRFYHSSNQHFKTPDFENDLFGVKVLPNGKKGGIYVAGQKFAYEGEYDSINRGVLFIKEKIPTKYCDVSRDRVSITSSNFCNIADWLINNTKEPMKLLKTLEPFIDDEENPLEKLLTKVLYSLGYDIEYNKHGAINFPDNYIAQTERWNIDSDMVDNLIANGYKIFPIGYYNLGMNSMANLIRKSREHIALEPTKNERLKLIIIKRALNLLSNLKYYFTEDELDTKIYIFDSKSKKENKICDYKYVQAEAIANTKEKKSYGFWIDKTYLNKKSFAAVLETTLHELSHKIGGDGDINFGYEITNVNEEVLNQIIRNPKIAEELRILSSIWDKI